MKALRGGAALLLLSLLHGCATLGSLGGVIQPPSFQVDQSQQAQLRLVGPGPGRPLGGASIRIFARVRNPNPLGLTLSTLAGGLLLEGQQAAQVNFPLGLPLGAGQETVVPLDIGISFSEIPGLAGVLTRAVTGAPIRYRLDGTVGVNAGLLGQPTFGPMTLLQGEARVAR